MKRIHNLDYLRGIAAFGIMAYHYLAWSFGEFSAEDFMGRFGLYGVSIFYCLSGLTLYSVYHEKFTFSATFIKTFFLKRIFRIFPLLWVATLLTIVVATKKPDVILLLLNLTGLFGFIKWNAYIATGAWSIGNELVFYVFFPIFIFLAKQYKIFLGVLSLVIFFVYCYFAFYKLSSAESISAQWRNYVNPLNQVFLFLGGVLLGVIFRKIKINNCFSLVLIILGLTLFIFYPVTGEPIILIIGANRLVFTAFCFMMCLGFYKLSFQLPEFIHLPLIRLGESSYSVYLLHPIIYLALMPWISNNFANSALPGMLFCALLTLISSYLVYLYVEKYFIKLGKRHD